MLSIALDKNSNEPLQQQIYEAIKAAIMSGKLKPGTRLPSTRSLSISLGVSRATVLKVFHNLDCEGYLSSYVGAGTCVNRDVLESVMPPDMMRPAKHDFAPQLALSERGAYLSSTDSTRFAVEKTMDEFIDFSLAEPHSPEPMQYEFKRLFNRCLVSNAFPDHCTDPQGLPRLREAIVQMLASTRHVICRSEQVFMMRNTQDAIDTIARIHIDTGDYVAMEEPSFSSARHTFQLYGAHVEGVQIDLHGLAIDQLDKRAKLVYVTPSHQVPTGIELSIQRRADLLQYAAKTRALIVEDDYGCEFNYGHLRKPAIHSLDVNDSVIYMGTFAKLLYATTRLSYLIIPPQLVETYRRSRQLMSSIHSFAEQSALEQFISTGELARHLRRTRVLHNRKRTALMRAIEKNFGAYATYHGETSGTHLVLNFKVPLNMDKLFEACHDFNVRFTPIIWAPPGSHNSFSIGLAYANICDEQIEEGIFRLAKAFKFSVAPAYLHQRFANVL
jgi:GntR family transcriptional regulator/MocR family aminotransferase